MSSPVESGPLDIEITVAELDRRLRAGERLRLIDVREPWEFDAAHLDGAEPIPMWEIPPRLPELALHPEAELVCYCHTGQRSLTAADWMRRSGLPRARSLAGGVDQWSREIDPHFPRY